MIQNNKSALIKNIKEYAVKHVPFYNKTINLSEITNEQNFNEFPIIEKSHIKDNSDAFISDIYNKENLIVEYTSGSTGNPIILYKSKAEMMMLEAKLYKIRNEAFPHFKSLSQIKFYAENITLDKKEFEKIIETRHCLYLSMLHLDYDSINEYINKIFQREEKFWMVGAPSVIHRIAVYVLQNDINLKDKIKFIELTGEIAFGFQVDDIKKAFGCIVKNHYGAREFWEIAYECECGALHILDDHVYVENVGNSFLVSTLDQKTMPLIRYKLGDNCEIIKNHNCGCGKTSDIIVPTGARTTDYILTKQGKVVSPIILYMVIIDINDSYNNEIKQFQAVQSKIDKIKLCLCTNITDKNILDEIQEFCKNDFYNILGERMELEIEFHNGFIKNDKKKFKYFISLL